jgi:hypothetical protein
MDWSDMTKAGEWFLTGWVFTMVAIGLVAIGSELLRRQRNAPGEARRFDEER